MKFKKGDKVIKAKVYSSTKYCRFGGRENEVPLGTQGIVERIDGDVFEVRFENGELWQLDEKELVYVIMKMEDIFPDNFQRNDEFITTMREKCCPKFTPQYPFVDVCVNMTKEDVCKKCIELHKLNETLHEI